MIIQHSLQLLEKLSEIEQVIKQVERYIEQNKLPVDRDKILEALIASRTLKKKN